MFQASDVPRVRSLHWVAEEGYLRVIDSSKALQVCLAGAEAQIWQLIDQDRLTVHEIVTQMQEQGLPEAQTLAVLERFLRTGLIYTRSYLWMEEDSAGEINAGENEVGA